MATRTAATSWLKGRMLALSHACVRRAGRVAWRAGRGRVGARRGVLVAQRMRACVRMCVRHSASSSFGDVRVCCDVGGRVVCVCAARV